MALREICGCIHLHTTYSDGGCGYLDIIKAARGARLDYVCVTDHMTLAARGDGWEGLRDGVFVAVGYEHNDADNHNHYLAFGTPATAEGAEVPQEYIDRVRKMGGIGFLAHPAEKRDYWGPYPWTDWRVTGFDGIELWNQISDWMEQLRGRWRIIKGMPGKRDRWKFWKLFFPNRLIKNAPADLIKRWDTMNRERFVGAIGGVDAHSRRFSFGPFGYRIFPIDVELRGIRTHLFVDETEWASGDTARMNSALLAALRGGHGFLNNVYRGKARGCRMYLQDDSGAIEYPGKPQNNLSLPMTMRVELTSAADIRLLRNGEVIQSVSGETAAWPITKNGVYRIEAYKGRNAWIYSNPFPVGRYPL